MDPAKGREDLLLQVLLNLSHELWVLKDRQMVLEKLLAESGIDAAEALDGWQPDQATKDALDAQRKEFIERILAPALSEPS